MFQLPHVPAGGPVARFGDCAAFEAFGFCDGSVKRRIGGCGFVLLDRDGECLLEGSAPVAAVTADSNCAEFEGLLHILEQGRARGLKHLWVGTDSFQLIEHIQKGSPRYGTYLDRLAPLCKHFATLQVQSIERSQNKRADALAREAIAHVR